jgi:hypothetical protein
VAEIDNYPTLVDAIWKIVQGTPEDRERVDFMFSEEQVAKQLGVLWTWESDACVFGIAHAINDLVDLGYCRGRATFNGHRWNWISPSPSCQDTSPSALFLTIPIPKLLSIRAKALQFIHEQTVRYSEGITFYSQEMWMRHEEFVLALLPSTQETDMFSARGTVMEAVIDLKETGFLGGSITSGALSFWVTLKGACWLLVAQPLLKLEERASRLATNPEILEATRLLINAYSEPQHNAAGSLYVTIEKLENATGGERGLISFLGQPRAYISDLKRSVQQHRHATTQAQANLNHMQCLERATEVIEKYTTLREQESN